MKRPADHHDKDVHKLKLAARSIADDYPKILDDEKAAQAGKSIVYAVDFSEIFSYIFLDKLSIAPRTDSDNFVLGVGFNEMVLHELLFAGAYRTFMLPSHRVELRQLRETIDERDIAGVAEVLNTLSTKLVLSEALTEAMKQFDADPEAALENPQLIAQIVNRAAQDAPAILLLARTVGSSARERLRRVIAELKLLPPKQLERPQTEPVTLDPDVVSAAMDRFTKLRSRHPESTNRVDAYAVAHLSQMLASAPSQTELRFVTRSITFRRVCTSLAAKKIISRNVVESVRHPRAFSAYVLSRGLRRDTLSFVREQLAAAQVFLDTMRKSGGSVGTSTPGRSTLTEVLQEIERVAILSSVVDSSDTSELAGRTRVHDVSHLVTLLRDTNQLKREFLSRANEIVDQLNVRTVDIAEDIAASVMDQQNLLTELRADLQLGTPNEKKTIAVAIARFAYAPVPYNLEFFNTLIAEHISKGDSPYEALMRFIRSSSPGQYERRLATAYLLGLSEDWSLALKFADAAIDEILSSDKTPRNEGYYFRAIARRQGLPWTEENIIASWKDLDCAQKLAAEVAEGKANDPRYLNERANILLQVQRSGIAKAALPGLGPSDDPITLWRQILNMETSPSYKLNALNNLTFAFWTSGDKTNTKSSLTELLTFVEKQEYDFEHLSPAIQETILGARLFVEMISSPADAEAARIAIERIHTEHPYVKKRPAKVVKS